MSHKSQATLRAERREAWYARRNAVMADVDHARAMYAAKRAIREAWYAAPRGMSWAGDLSLARATLAESMADAKLMELPTWEAYGLRRHLQARVYARRAVTYTAQRQAVIPAIMARCAAWGDCFPEAQGALWAAIVNADPGVRSTRTRIGSVMPAAIMPPNPYDGPSIRPIVRFNGVDYR